MSHPQNFQQIPSSGSNPEVPANENFTSINWTAVYGMDPDSTSGLTWGYLGGRWGGFAVAAGTLALTGSGSPDTWNYIVVAKATGVISVSTSSTNWSDTANYARVYRIQTAASAVDTIEDHRGGPHGIFSSGGSTLQSFIIPVSDEVSAIVAATGVFTFRMPYAFTLTEVRASVTVAPEVGSPGEVLVIDFNVNGSSRLSTKLHIDQGERTSTTAAIQPVISDASLADDDEVSFDIDVGSPGARGLKVTLIGEG